MPHVVIKGPISVEDVWLAFTPLEFAEGGVRFKAEEALLSRDKQAVVIRSLVIERGFVKCFLVRMAQREGGGEFTITLDKLTRPELSDGVKRILGLYAWQILSSEPQASVGATNIPDLIGAPKS